MGCVVEEPANGIVVTVAVRRSRTRRRAESYQIVSAVPERPPTTTASPRIAQASRTKPCPHFA